MTVLVPDPRPEPGPSDDRLSRLTTLLEVARMLTSELDLPEIVHQVLVGAIEVIPAADAGTLYLCEAETGRLIVTDSVGFGPSIFKLSLEPGEGAAGKAFYSGRGAIYADPVAVNGALAGASSETLRLFQEASQGLRSPKAAMSVPLVFKGSVLGALVVDTLKSNTQVFAAADLQMLEDFAQIAAIAIVNARLFDMEHRTRVRLQVVNDELTRQRDELDRRLRALDSMSQIAREGFELDALAKRLAGLTAGRVFVLDGLARVRAMEPAEVEPAATRRVQGADVAELLRRVSRDHHRHLSGSETGRLIASPIAAGPELLGYVLVETAEQEPDSLLEVLVDSAALIASTAFVQERAREEGDLRRRADLLQRLLDGDVPKSAASFRAFQPPFRLAVGRLQRSDGQSVAPASPEANVLRELRGMTEDLMRKEIVASVVATRGEHVVVAWSLAPNAGKFNPTSKLGSLAQAMRGSEGWSVRFAVTEPIVDPRAVPHAYEEARLTLEIRPASDETVIDVGALGAYRLIIGATSGTTAVDFSRRTLRAVVEHDAKRQGTLLPTLRTYLSLGMSVTATARALGIHIHTVQYRLAKVEELAHLNLRDSEDRLNLELSLRIFDLARSAERTTAASPG